MKLNRNIVAAMLAALLALGAVACETENGGEDPLQDGGTPGDTMTEPAEQDT